MRHTVTRIGVLSLAQIQMVMFALFGLVAGAFVFMLTLSAGATVAGLVFLIVFPIVSGVGGLVSGIITGWLYNLAARWVGGVDIWLSGGNGAEDVA